MNPTPAQTAAAEAIHAFVLQAAEAAAEAAEAAEETAEEAHLADRATISSIDPMALTYAPDFAARKVVEAASHLLRAEATARKAQRAAETALAAVLAAKNAWAKAPF